ncbi:MAG: BrnA antitoxin family protein [Alphaproteobacteria bacterium]|nr:BrnA antitoxin family protein [Alphaproteobacteria bacterium]
MEGLPKNKRTASDPRRRARKGEPVKKAVSIRLSPEVIMFFKAKGPGWQTRIDKALRALVTAME